MLIWCTLSLFVYLHTCTPLLFSVYKYLVLELTEVSFITRSQQSESALISKHISESQFSVFLCFKAFPERVKLEDLS